MTKPLVLCLYLSGLSLVCGLLNSVTAQIQEVGAPFVKNYSPAEYRSHDQNWAIIQDSDGVMYFANNNGILEYDGVSWRIIPVPNRTVVRSLAIDPETGVIYVGAQGELGCLAPDSTGEMVYRSLISKIPNDSRDFVNVWRTYINRSGVFFQTNSHVFRFDRADQEHSIKKDETPVRIWRPSNSFHFSFMVRDTLFVTERDQGLMKLVGDSLVPVVGGAIFDKQTSVFSMLPCSGNRILIVTQRGLFIYSGTGIEKIKAAILDRYLSKAHVYNGVETAYGTFVLATLRGGIAEINEAGDVIRVIDQTTGLQDYSVKALYIDREDGLWLALNKGLARVEVFAPFSVFDESSGYSGTIESMIRYEGTLYLTTQEGTFYLDPKAPSFETVGPQRKTPVIFKRVPGIDVESWSFLIAGGSLLVSTYNGGVFEKRGKSVRRVTHFPSVYLYRSRSDTNRVFVGLFDGLSSLRLENGVWRDEGRVEGVHWEIRSMAEPGDGYLWMGTEADGAVRLALNTLPRINPDADSVSMVHFSTEHGLPAEGVNVYFQAGCLVFGTDHGEIFEFDAARSRFVPNVSFKTLLGLPDGEVVPRVEDALGNVWLNLKPRNAGAWFSAVAFKKEEQTYRLERLMNSRVRFVGGSYALYPEANGIIWFLHESGLGRYDMNSEKAPLRDFHALIRRVIVNGDSLIFSGHSPLGVDGTPQVRLQENENSLRFEYAATSFGDELENLYQVYLEGFDEDWLAWTTETRKDYTRIPEGKYRFRVRSRNVYQRESIEGVFEFKIKPPWSRTWWAYFLYLVLAFVAISGIIKWRSFKLEREKRELEKIIKVRSAQLVQAEKMASIGQMTAGLAHEINNPITFVYGNLEYIKEGFENVMKLQDLTEKEVSTKKMNRVEAKKKDLKYDKLRDDVTKAISSSMAGSKRIRDIIGNLTKFSKLHEAEFQEINLRKEIETILDLFIRQSSDIVIKTKFAKIPNIPCLAGEMNQCFRNVLINSVQTIRDAETEGVLEKGKGCIRIVTSNTRIDGKPFARIAITDNGMGIPESVKNKVFDPFFTTRDVGGGKGLGLSEVYSTVQKHNGSIEIESEERKGATVVINLPLESTDMTKQKGTN